MAVHKLQVTDFYEDEPFTLFGIHCTIEDYRLAYQLNKALRINLYRKPNNLDDDNPKINYAIYEWTDNQKLITWHLVCNSCKIEEELNVEEDITKLNLGNKTTKSYYLMPELKKINFLLKVSSHLSAVKQKLLLQDMQSITEIITAYTIQPQQIKSKHNLIF